MQGEPRLDAEQVDQLLFGEPFDVAETADGWSRGRAVRDGYAGYVQASALAPRSGEPTHWLSAPRSYAFPHADFKSAPPRLLSMNALVRVVASESRFLQAEAVGWIAETHLSLLGRFRSDAAAVAEQFLGAPYRWGGRDSLGLDCSGLVQQALYACGKPCPRDSDMQAGFGAAVTREALQRGDLVCWPGHVGMMLDAERLIHANAHHMAVAVEPLQAAITRIEAAGQGRPTAYRRP